MIGCRGIVGLARHVGPSTCVSQSGVHVGLKETFGNYWAVTIGDALSAATSTLHGERCVHGPHALARIGVAFVAMSISLAASSAIAAIVRSPAPGSNSDRHFSGPRFCGPGFGTMLPALGPRSWVPDNAGSMS